MSFNPSHASLSQMKTQKNLQGLCPEHRFRELRRDERGEFRFPKRQNCLVLEREMCAGVAVSCLCA